MHQTNTRAVAVRVLTVTPKPEVSETWALRPYLCDSSLPPPFRPPRPPLIPIPDPIPNLTPTCTPGPVNLLLVSFPCARSFLQPPQALCNFFAARRVYIHTDCIIYIMCFLFSIHQFFWLLWVPGEGTIKSPAEGVGDFGLFKRLLSG